MKLPRLFHRLKADVDEFKAHIDRVLRQAEQLGLKKDICPTCGHLRGLDGNCRWCGEIDR